MPVRKIILIDEDKCDGCAVCVDACHEGAIRIVDGKAKLVSDILCDGFGDCLGECPQGAITIVEREAAEYSEAAVKVHLARVGAQHSSPGTAGASALSMPTVGGCPGSAARQLTPETPPSPSNGEPAETRPSALRNWPVQLHLLPVQAPYFSQADLLIAADCVPFAHAGFHETLLAGRTLLIGCPKLDDTSAYQEKLAAIFRFNDIRSVEVAVMEVPCCRGLVHLVDQAIEAAGKADTLRPRLARVGIRGEIQERV